MKGRSGGRRLLSLAGTCLNGLAAAWLIANPAHASGRLEAGFTAGPESYRETRLALDFSPTEWLAFGAEAARSEVPDAEAHRSYSGNLDLSPIPALTAGFGAGFSPESNDVRSDTVAIDLSMWLLGLGTPPGFETLVRAGYTRTRFEFHLPNRWVDLIQQGYAADIAQTLWNQWAISMGVELYRYDRELDAGARRLLFGAVRDRRDRAQLLNAFGYLTGLPRRQFSLGLDWLAMSGGRVGAWWQQIDAEVEEFGEREYRYGVDVSWPLGRHLEASGRIELDQVGSQRDPYYSLGLGLVW